ncbi:MAG: helix-turn-helix domain-containing protein [Blastocatellia bacterium]
MKLSVITTKEAAERLGITQRRINALIKAGKLPAQIFGGSWMIEEKDLALVADRKPGRPSKDGAKAAKKERVAKASAKQPGKTRAKKTVG